MSAGATAAGLRQVTGTMTLAATGGIAATGKAAFAQPIFFQATFDSAFDTKMTAKSAAVLAVQAAIELVAPSTRHLPHVGALQVYPYDLTLGAVRPYSSSIGAAFAEVYSVGVVSVTSIEVGTIIVSSNPIPDLLS